MRDERDRAVVVFGRHLERRRAEVEREALDECEVGGGGLLVAADDPGAPDEDVGARRDRAAALAAGERMRADVVREVDAAVAQRAQRLELDARDIGHDGVSGCRASSRSMTSAVTSGGTATTISDGSSSSRGRPARAVVDREAQLRRRRVVERDVDAARA